MKEQFPPVEGETVICRECLVEGDVSGDDIRDFCETRALFLSKTYGGSTGDYFENVVPEFNKIQKIESEAEVYLWFEDDLFCQVNLWFVLSLLKDHKQVYLVRPSVHTQYGFGGFDQKDLVNLYENRVHLKNLTELSQLWSFYQNENLESLKKAAQKLQSAYPFILNAVKAHLNRLPSKKTLGRPTESLIQIMKDLQTEEFGPVFREFCKRESIYGFGDSQVKRLHDQIIEKH